MEPEGLRKQVQRITISADQRQAGLLTLAADQRHYLLRVLRLRAGDRFIAQDGQGQQWLAALTEQPDQADILEALIARAPTAPLRLIAALPKGNGFDQVVRQTTELGVTHIYPVLSDRTLLKPSASKLTRWRRIAQEAAEQSEQVSVPEIFDPIDFRQCLAQVDSEGLRYLCAARTDCPHLLAHLQTHLTSSAPSLAVTLAIGPEGGWTAAEITDATAQGYEVVSLGAAVLRAVTAPITALSLITAARELLI